MKKSTIAKGKLAKLQVFKGTKEKTKSGLKKTDLKLNKAGKVVSKRRSDATKKSKAYKTIIGWSSAFSKARKQLGIKGFVPCKKGEVRRTGRVVVVVPWREC